MTLEFTPRSPDVAVLPVKEKTIATSIQLNEVQENVELAVKAVRRASNVIEELVT